MNLPHLNLLNMASLSEIRKAKEIGKSIKTLRESRGLSTRVFASRACLPVKQVLNLEEGNYYAFHQSLDEFMSVANRCIETLEADSSKRVKTAEVFTSQETQSAQTIPQFLRRT
jgi:transcriptional regulator with XRE-family HTH domain